MTHLESCTALTLLVRAFDSNHLFILAQEIHKKLKMTVFAVLEHRNKKLNNVVRTLFCHHPKNKIKSIGTWAIVPKKEIISSEFLFASDLLPAPSAATTKK